jgi:hypothetical protein
MQIADLGARINAVRTLFALVTTIVALETAKADKAELLWETRQTITWMWVGLLHPSELGFR